MGTGLFDYISQACQSLAASTAPSITATGTHIVLALATIMLVWFGVQESLSSEHGGPGFSMARFLNLIILLTFACVMMIHIEEAVARRTKADGQLTRTGLHAVVMEGALLRLRPKVMTMATLVAGLLPLLWSTHTGAEFMRPLAAPVLGGMLSSPIHVLIVTPAILTSSAKFPARHFVKFTRH